MICEKCNSPMVEKQGVHGAFLACSAYPECRNTKKIQSGIYTDKGAEEHMKPLTPIPTIKSIKEQNTGISHSPRDASIVAQCLTKVVFSQEGERSAAEVLSTYKWFLGELSN